MTEYMNHSYQKYDLSFRKDITDTEIENLSETSPNLNELNIAGSKNIKGETLYKLAEKCQNLKVVNLSFFRNLISKENLLKFFSKSNKLQDITIVFSNGIDDEVLFVIMNTCKDLEYLDVAECPKVTKKGIIHFIENCPTLKGFYLDFINDELQIMFPNIDFGSP
jgi:ferredoxin-fold anticodon binding domain-containing protein